MAERDYPVLIQGGMGVAVSTHRLANAVATEGQNYGKNVLATVSGTGLSPIMAFRLGKGDEETIRVLKQFNPRIAQSLINEYPAGGHRIPEKPRILVPGRATEEKRKMTELTTIMAAYTEVTLAKKGHSGEVAVNLLEKTQLSNICTILGAMMAGVDYVCVGAGIPYQIPGILTAFANGDPATYKVDIVGSTDKLNITLDPKEYVPERTKLKKPQFFLIASQHILPMRLDADGFIIENYLAGGHNAPARGKQIGADGQPIYGPKDDANLEQMNKLKPPFYLAGGYGGPDKLKEAQSLGAKGVQVGSIFALSRESGLRASVKLKLLKQIKERTLRVKTSPTASPSGFPFQVVELDGTLSKRDVLEKRLRICRYGHLVEAFQIDPRNPERIGYRCPGEPIKAFVGKGGDPSLAETSMCLCSGLVAATEYGDDAPGGSIEPMVVTLGKDTSFVRKIETGEDGMYSAADVVKYMLRNYAQNPEIAYSEETVTAGY